MSTTTQNTSSELEAVQHAEVRVLGNDTDLVPLHEVRAALTDKSPITPIDPDLVSDMIAQRLLRTTDIDQLMNPEANGTSEKIIGQVFQLRSAAFMPSDLDEAKYPVYVVLDVILEDGTETVWTTSAQGVMIQVLSLIESGFLPRRVKLIEVGNKKGARSRPIYLQDVLD